LYKREVDAVFNGRKEGLLRLLHGCQNMNENNGTMSAIIALG
jgi:hypothetical protein